MVLTIASARPNDVPALTELLEELDLFYGATGQDPREQRMADIQVALFNDEPAAHALLARVDDDVVGIAAYSYLWPAAGVTASIFLKELYVRQANQRQGVGRALMRALCELAVKQGCSRVEWTTERDNAVAQGFYATLGAPVNPVKVFYRLEGPGLHALAGGDTG